MKPWEEMTEEEREAEGREVLAWIEEQEAARPEGGERVINIVTGEVTEVPPGWAWDNYMEFLHG